MSLLTAVIPPWARWLAISLALAFTFMTGQMRGERIAGDWHNDYVAKQAGQTAKIAQAQAKVVIKTEIEYRDRIQKIYIKGEKIEKQVPVYITAADNAGCSINTGFVRHHNAAWTGEPAGPAADSDRGPASVSLADVASAEAHNASACLAWREQVVGFRDYYQKLKAATDRTLAE